MFAFTLSYEATFANARSRGKVLVAALVILKAVDELAPPVWLFLGTSSLNSFNAFHSLRLAWGSDHLGFSLLDRENSEGISRPPNTITSDWIEACQKYISGKSCTVSTSRDGSRSDVFLIYCSRLANNGDVVRQRSGSVLLFFKAVHFERNGIIICESAQPGFGASQAAIDNDS